MQSTTQPSSTALTYRILS